MQVWDESSALNLVNQENKRNGWGLDDATITQYAEFLVQYAKQKAQKPPKQADPITYQVILGHYHQEQAMIHALKHTADSNHQAYFEQVQHHCQKIAMRFRSTTAKHAIISEDDIVQQALLKIWSKLDTYLFESSFFTWIGTIISNEAFQLFRKEERKKYDQSLEPEDASETPWPNLSDQEQHDLHALIEDVKRLLQHHKDPRLLEIFEMFCLDAPTLKQIADKLHLKITRSHHLLTILRAIIKAYLEDNE